VSELFRFANLFAMAGWLLLIVAPRWRWTARLVVSGFWSLLLSLVYLVLIARFMPGAEGGFSSIEEVRTFFGFDALLLAGWVHYLAFDLLIGAFEVRQAQRDGIPHLLLVPCLAFTCFLGPIGLLLFFAVKSVRQKRIAEVVP
jgi:hypothetical protein